MKKVIWRLWGAASLATLLFLVGPGSAQEITGRPAPPSAPPPGGFRLEPLQPRERMWIREQDFRPEPQLADHAPALIHPLTGQARIGSQVIRFGASAWTAPHEVGDGITGVERNGGVLAFGLTFVWGTPEEETTPKH